MGDPAATNLPELTATPCPLPGPLLGSLPCLPHLGLMPLSLQCVPSAGGPLSHACTLSAGLRPILAPEHCLAASPALSQPQPTQAQTHLLLLTGDKE